LGVAAASRAARSGRPVLLFDLGGVLVENAIFDELARLWPEAPDAESLRDRWLRTEAVRRFERGHIDADAFAKDFVEQWGLPLEPESFLASFRTWVRGPYVGALELLERLHVRHAVAILSNCNVVDWERLAAVRACADHAFSSHIVGAVKPDPEIFEHVIASLGRAPGDIVFFDDSATNVRAAQALGLRAHQTVGFEALLEAIEGLGL